MENSKPTKLIIIDTETSALFSNLEGRSPQILQLACLIVDWNTLETEASTSIDFKFDDNYFLWEDEAYSVHGISKQREGLNLNLGLTNFYKFLSEYQLNKDVKIKICGWNIKYDIDILRQNIHTLQINQNTQKELTPLDRFLYETKIFDLASIGFATGINNSLELCQYIGIERNKHNAMQDCFMCLKYLKFLKSNHIW